MDYKLLCEQLESLCEGVDNTVSKLSNAAALLWYSLGDINWAGFYLFENGELNVGPFQGKPACAKIALKKGVCGTAAAENRIIRVDDVHKFKGHIACDGASNSEIVIPININGELFGVLDIDSPLFSRFSDEDEAGLRKFVKVLEGELK